MSRTRHHSKKHLSEPLKSKWEGGGWLKNEPKEWRKLMKHRKRRAACARARHRALIDPEAALFPLDRKPHIYYW